MRIEKIDAYGQNSSVINNAKTTPAIQQGYDSVSFKGEEKKPSVFKRAKDMFVESFRQACEEIQVSDEIKTMLSELDRESTKLKKDAKWDKMLLNELILLGKEKDYRGYIDFKPKEGKKLLFGEIDEQTGLPTEVSIVNVKNGFRVDSHYRLYDGLNHFQRSDCTIEGIDMKTDYFMGRTLAHRQYETFSGVIRELIPQDNGFYYFQGTKDDEGNIVDTSIEVSITKDLGEDSFVKFKNDKGEIESYHYNPKRRRWLLDSNN